MAWFNRADFHLGNSSIIQWKRMQQVCRRGKVHASQQRKIVARLQKPEMLKDGLLCLLTLREGNIRGYCGLERVLQIALLQQKCVKQCKSLSRNRRPVRVCGKQIIGMH